MNTTTSRINISEKMHELVLNFHNGVEELHGVSIQEMQPECEDEWNEHYAIVYGLVEPFLGFYDDAPYVTIDMDSFRCDLESYVKKQFVDDTEIDIKFYWQSQEIEVHRRGMPTRGQE